jgi:hypothetical protein
MSRRATAPNASFFLVIAAVFCSLLPAQEGTGQIVGTVTDASRAYVPGAKVSLAHTATGANRSTVSDSYGGFLFAGLPIGEYEVTIRMPGFATVRHTGVTVAVGLPTRLDVELQPSAVPQEITVQGGVELLNTQSAEGGRVLTPGEVTSLPLSGRNFLNLVTLQTGIQLNTATGRQSFVINGSPPHQGVNFLVDGTDGTGIETTEVGGGWLSSQTTTFALGLDSIAEFTVHTGNYSARYGRAMGGVIEAVTKSGTNQIHGNVFEFLRNNALNANQTQNNAAGVPIPKLEFNQFGANSGGPIVKDKMFFWVGYEGLRRIVGQSHTFTTLSDLGRASVVDPDMANFVRTYLPRANTQPTSNPYLALLVRNDLPRIREDMGTGRWDYHPSARDTFFARYNIHDTASNEPSFGTPKNDVIDSARQQIITLSGTHIFSPTTTGNIRLGVNRVVNLTQTTGPPAGVNLAGIFSLAGGFLNNWAIGLTEAGDFSRVHGRHTFSAGFEFRQLQNNRSQGLPAGSFSYLPGPNQLTNFFNNVPDQLSEGFVILGNAGTSGNVGGYFEDSFKATHNLTITAGLRYDYFLRPLERHGRMIGIVGSPFPLSQLQFTKPGEQVVKKDLNGFQPRLGLAWSISPRFVFRAGSGIYVGQAYNAVTTAAASTFVPPIIPKNLFDPYYVHPQEFFTRQQISNLHWPDDSVASPAALLQNVPPPTPNLPLPDWGNSVSYQWSAIFEGEIVKGTQASLGYVGSRTRGIVSDDYYNLPDPFHGGVRPNPAFGPIQLRGSCCHAHYNGLQATLRRPLGRGVEMNLHYTWAHSIDDTTGFSGNNDPGVTPQTNSLSLQRGNSTFDIRHNFNADFYYDLPLGRMQSHPGELLTGWTLGGIVRTNTGAHYSATTGGNVGDGVHTQRPNVLCADPSTGNATGLFSQILNKSCFATPTVANPVSGYFIGTLGRNTLTAPSVFTLDSYLQKNTRLTERLTHQFRAEFFNSLNNTNWGQPVASLNNPNFGRILGAGDGRQLQFAMKLIW